MLRTLIPAIQHIFRSVDLNKSVQPPAVPTKKSSAKVTPSQPQVVEQKSEQK